MGPALPPPAPAAAAAEGTAGGETASGLGPGAEGAPEPALCEEGPRGVRPPGPLAGAGDVGRGGADILQFLYTVAKNRVEGKQAKAQRTLLGKPTAEKKKQGKGKKKEVGVWAVHACTALRARPVCGAPSGPGGCIAPMFRNSDPLVMGVRRTCTSPRDRACPVQRNTQGLPPTRVPDQRQR
jgi:hypothetical protein